MTAHLHPPTRPRAIHRPPWWHALPALLLTSVACSAVTVETSLSSRFLVRGERALLEVVVSGTNREQPQRPPTLPESDGVTLRPLNTGRPEIRMLERRELAYVFTYSVQSFEVGKHLIPALTVSIGGRDFSTRPRSFDVFPSEQLSWMPIPNEGAADRCAAAFHVADPKPFENETVPVELKLYIPSEIADSIPDWGIPDFERDGVAVWRFEPKELKSDVILNGRDYTGISYPSTLTPTRSGSVTIGPARLRLMKIHTILDAFGPRRDAKPLWLDIAATTVEARPLPPGAPPGFHNAVGAFSITAASEVEEIREGDPVVVNLDVTGTGNLDSLVSPEPVNAPGWKSYEPTRMPRGAERTAIEGTIHFRQFLRPLDLQTQIPAFRLVFFDPDREQYDTALSQPIPLRILPSTLTPPTTTAPPPAAGIPVEHMTDILGTIDAGPPGSTRPIPWRIAWHLLPALIAAGLLLRIAWLWLAPRLHKDPTLAARHRDFKTLGSLPPDTRRFYRGVGGFIERWLGDRLSEEQDLAAIINQRDSHCFNPSQADSPLPSSERHRVLQTLRRHLSALLVAAPIFLAASRLDAANPATPDDPAAAYQAGHYVEAAKSWLSQAPYDQLDAARLYNIGNCWYRLGSAGNAALYYRRALLRQPGHPEALQNLRFLERRFGSLTIKRPDYQYVLARLPVGFWSGLVWAGAWLLAIGLLCFPATRPGSRIRIVAAVALVSAPIAAGVGGLGWRYYPDDAGFAPPARQAVVITDDAVVFSDASRSSPEVIDAPPGSLCQVVATRGLWSYVAFATKTRGWLPSTQIEPLIPVHPPQPPAAARPSASDTST